MYKEILEKIKEFSSISIFHHQRPDGDCMFSCLALESFIHDNFKEKKVKIGGEEIYDLYPRNDKLSQKYINESLALVVDTSNSGRIDDLRALKAPFMIKIDHHPIVEQYGDINLVDVKASSCCEVIATMMFSREFKECILSENTCRYLYCGIIADTINFRTTNVTYKTMSIASKLIKKGNLDVSQLVENIMDKNLDSFNKTTAFRNYLKIENRFGYVVLTNSELQKLGLTPMEAKINIDEIGRIKDLMIWSVATEKDGLYDVSIRSKRGYVINSLCREYGGGGHVNAAATKQITKKQLDQMYEILSKMSLERH